MDRNVKQPPTGWTTPVKLVKVIDGDTIRVKFERELDIRITDDDETFDTPEVRGVDDEEKAEGRAATTALQMILAGKLIHIHVPTDDRSRVKDIFSIGSRAVGHVFVDGEDVTDKMTELGYNKSKIEFDLAEELLKSTGISIKPEYPKLSKSIQKREQIQKEQNDEI